MGKNWFREGWVQRVCVGNKQATPGLKAGRKVLLCRMIWRLPSSVWAE